MLPDNKNGCMYNKILKTSSSCRCLNSQILQQLSGDLLQYFKTINNYNFVCRTQKVLHVTITASLVLYKIHEDCIAFLY